MAVTNQYTTQYTAEKGAPTAALAATQSLKVEILPFDFTQSGIGDATSTIKVRRLPPGLVWFFPQLSRYTSDDIGSTGTMAFGHGAYTKTDGTAVVAALTLFDATVDISGQALDAAFGAAYVFGTTAHNGQFKKFDSREGVDLTITINTSTIADASQIHGYLVIAR